MKKKVDSGLWFIAVLALLVILAIVFTADDITGLGEVLDPLEYVVVGIVLYYVGKNKKKIVGR